MNKHGRSFCLTVILTAAVLFLMVSIDFSAEAQEGEIRLLIRGDDIGSSHAANVACIKSYREGIMRSVEVMVPCPWFKEAVQMLNENPGLDVGIHLDLTSEWEFYKWGPITNAPSLVDDKGYFLPMTSQRDDFPPNTGFRESNFDMNEVEKELRAQIEIGLREIKNVSHISGHMGTTGATPELRELVQKLSKEYNLPTSATVTGRTGRFPSGATPAEKVAAMVEILENLKPGTWLFIEHPGLDTPEMRAIGHEGYRDVAIDREGVTQAFTSERVKAVIERRGIKLISYADLYKE
ncbi:polysaccharide deacetylase family protein [Candidatus Latescibacterota bacterium]